MNILCIIPARSGSKGIKNKNIQKIKKLTLIEHSFIFALLSSIFQAAHFLSTYILFITNLYGLYLSHLT